MKQLYRFVEADLIWTLTSSDTEIVYDDELYIPTAIGRDEPEVKNEIARADLEITLPLTHELAIRNLRNVVEAQVSLTVFSSDEGDIDTEWKGRLAAVKPGVADVKLVFESIFTSQRRPGLRKRVLRICPHVVYGEGCELDMADFAVPGTVTSVTNGITVVVPAAAGFDDGYFRGGMIEGPDGVLRYITAHTGSTLVLLRPVDSVVATAAVNIYPGCDRLKETCATKFNNILNNGSYPWLPIRNPFDGRSVV